MKRNKIIVGSRASELALTQTRWVIQSLKEKFNHIDFEIIEIKTIGDKILDKTLDKIGGKGLFVKEIEAALLQNEIDIAVHSMKDVPTEMTEDLMIGAITKREDIRDVLISKNGLDIANLPLGARIGTSSLRRAAQLLNFRPDLQMEPIRGNIATRIKKIEQLGLDGVILAAAGILRMGWEDQITEYISTDICIPAVGQGALGIQVRSKDQEIIDIVRELNDPTVEICVNAERSFMRELKGGCHVPIGAYAWMDGDNVKMKTVVSAPDGKEQIKMEETSHPRDGEMLGINMATKSLKQGAKEILTRIEAGE